MAEPQLCLSMSDITNTTPSVVSFGNGPLEDILFGAAFAPDAEPEPAPEPTAHAAGSGLLPFVPRPKSLVEADLEAMELEGFNFRAAS